MQYLKYQNSTNSTKNSTKRTTVGDFSEKWK